MYNLTSLEEIQKIEIEASSYCNAGCPYCDRHLTGTSTRDPGFTQKHLPFALIKKLKTDFGNLENKLAWFVGNLGDALMNPEIDKIWEFALQEFKGVDVETNGGLRSVDFWKNMGKIAKENPHKGMMSFSIDGLEDTNEIYRKKVKWNVLMDNVKAFIDAGGQARWRWLVFDHNEHQVDEAKQLAKDLGFKSFAVEYSTRYNKTLYGDVLDQTKNKVYTDKKGKQVVAETVDLSTNVNNKVDEVLKKVNYFSEEKIVTCKNLKQQRMYLNAKGRIWPCCFHSAYYDKFDDLRTMDPAILPYYKNGFNDYHSKNMQEIFDSELWKQMTASWTAVDLKNNKAPFNFCVKKCLNNKWEATCNIKEKSNWF